MMKNVSKKTQCVHSGKFDDERMHGINTPIYTSTSYQYLDTDELLRLSTGIEDVRDLIDDLRQAL